MLYTALRDAGHTRALVPQVKVASAGQANAQTSISVLNQKTALQYAEPFFVVYL